MSQSDVSPVPAKVAGDGTRRIGDVWQWLGISGDAIGTSGVLRRTFSCSYAVVMVIIAAINTLNVISVLHDAHHLTWIEPVIWEGSSWVTVVLFLWIPWVAYRLAPPFVRPRWRLLIHVPALLAYSAAHIGGFLLLRVLAYRAMGEVYVTGTFWSRFTYEGTKDALGYVLFMAG
ncbi:MAG TPA: hypothetical protein VHM27_05850, partial [Rhizomicrobium sp.]|nr:hypothetical protein [Rhizomicrobium sp.]